MPPAESERYHFEPPMERSGGRAYGIVAALGGGACILGGAMAGPDSFAGWWPMTFGLLALMGGGMSWSAAKEQAGKLHALELKRWTAVQAARFADLTEAQQRGFRQQLAERVNLCRWQESDSWPKSERARAMAIVRLEEQTKGPRQD